MRNWTLILVSTLMLGGWFFYVGFLKPDEIYKHETQFGDLFLFFIMLFFAGMYGKELMYKYSCHGSGYGDHTSLMNIVPIGETEVKDIKETSKNWVFKAYARGGNSFLGMRGGGTHGFTVAREDLILSMQGDPSNVIWYGVPDYYRMEQGPDSKYKDATKLHKNILKMVLRLPNFTPKSIIVVYDTPFSPDPRDKIRFLEQMNWKDLYESATQNGFGKDALIDDLQKTISKLGSSVKKISHSFSGQQESFAERTSRRQRDEVNEDEERR